MSAPPVAATRAECDACIDRLTGDMRRVAIVMRFAGLGISQVLALDWEDFDLDGQALRN